MTARSHIVDQPGQRFRRLYEKQVYRNNSDQPITGVAAAVEPETGAWDIRAPYSDTDPLNPADVKDWF